MSSDVSAAIKWIGSALIAEGKYLYGIKDLVSDLQKDLQYMQLFLQKVDANPNPVREDDALSLLTPDMTRLANRATDAIDTYRHNLQSKVNRGNWFLSGLSLGFHFYPVHKLRKEIEAIHKDTEKAKKRYEDYSKIAGTTSNPQQQAAQPNPESYLHLNNEFVVGIEDDIVDLVTKLTDLTNDFDVLGIVGTGGAGKSTLATQIYRHDRVQTWFSYKAFVSVSQQWDTVDVLSRILVQIMHRKDSLPSNEKELSEKLHACMRGRKCLVVLDDIWTTGACDAIYTLLPHTKGIRVVITTRKEEVAKHPSTRRVIHKPKLLTDEQKLELFKKVAVDGRNDIDYDVQFSNLVSEMLAKIEGLPLAVVTLGGILRRKQDFDEWDMVNKDCSSYIINGKGGARYGSVKDMLRLSYLDLPPHMKDCFLYLGIIPEDREFSCQKIAQMWIAEGFIPNKSQMGKEALENTAMCVILELARHCILQVTERHPLGRVERFRVHDLIREFCIEMAKEKNFLQVATCTSLDVTSRRLSICSREYVLEENQELITLVYNGQARTVGVLTNTDSIHTHFKMLGVLSIQSLPTCTLPKQIGNLIHLTYLSLVNSGIYKLPESIRDLHHILYFEYRSDTGIGAVIPENLVRNMLNLRLLELPIFLADCPSSLGLSAAHKNLHTLKSGAGRWIQNDLIPAKTSSLLNLHIYDVYEPEEIRAVYDYHQANLLTLHLTISQSRQGFELQKLSSFLSLQSLYVHGPVAVVGPLQFPPILTALTLICTNLGEGVGLMDVLGQLSKLKYLCLEWNALSGEKLTCESNTAFPQLQELRLECLDGLKEWEMETGAMRNLRKIGIRQCLGLKKLPACIGAIATLRELEAQVMSDEFCGRLGYGSAQPGFQDYGVDSGIVANIFSVKVTAQSAS